MRISRLVIALAMIAATVALGACSNENEPEVVDITKPIDLNIGVGSVTQTRVAIVNPTAFETGDAIGIYLATADKNVAPGETTSVAAGINAGKAVNNVQFTKTSNSWDGVIYWQNTSQWHTLYGYYPYDSSLSGTTTTKSVTVAADQHAQGTVGTAGNVQGAGYKNADYLWAENTAVMASTNTQPMELQHKMSRIVIKLTAGNGLSDTELEALSSSLKIVNRNQKGEGNISVQGTFDIKTGTITADEQQAATKLAEITPYRVETTTAASGGTATPKEYSYYAILLPGTSFTEKSDFVQLKAADETTYLYKLGTSSALTLVAAKEYIFTLKANKTGIALDGFTIKAWENVTSDADGNADMVVPEAQN